MKPAAIPENDKQRLKTLHDYRVLDTESERCFDEITELVADICKTPVALISLVDEKRQWFKSRVGMSCRESSREISFCGHAILQDELMVVADALHDPRFADNPFVHDNPPLRFYAGAPLKTSAGHNIGTLCVIDHVPRTLSVDQQKALSILASQVVMQLELHRLLNNKNSSLQEIEQLVELRTTELVKIKTDLEREIQDHKSDKQALLLWHAMIEASNEGFIITDCKQEDNPIIYFNEGFQKLTGYDKDEIMGCNCRFLQGPETDRSTVTLIQQAVADKLPVNCEILNYKKDGDPFWNLLNLRPMAMEGSEVTHFIGTQTDITRRKLAEAESERRNEQLLRNREVLLNLANTNFPDQQVAFNHLLKTDAETLNLTKVSIWFYNEDNTSINRQYLYQNGKASYAIGSNLNIADYPHYFAALNQSNVLSVVDAIHDPRTRELAENYLLPLGITSMMDVPIRYQGQIIGIVCHEHIGQARKWSREDENFATAIADMCAMTVEHEERRQIESNLIESEETLNRAQSIAHLGSWVCDLATGQEQWSDEQFRIFGYQPGEIQPTVQFFLACVHEEDRDRVQQIYKDIEDGINAYECEYRIVRPTGEIRYIHARGEISHVHDADSAKMMGTVHDITERKLTDRKLNQSFRALNVLSKCDQALIHISEKMELLEKICEIIVRDGGYRFAWIGYAEQDENQSVRKVAWFGEAQEQLASIEISWGDKSSGQGPTGTALRTGKHAITRDILNTNLYPEWKKLAKQLGYSSGIGLPLSTGTNEKAVLTIYAPDTDAFDPAEVKLLLNLANNLSYGITFLQSKIEKQKMEETLQKNHRVLAMLNQANDAVIHAVNEKILLDDICRIIVRKGDYIMSGVGFTATDQSKTINMVAHYGNNRGYLEKANVNWDEHNKRGCGPVGIAIRSRQPYVVQDIANEPSMALWRQEALLRGYAADIALPLIHNDIVLGILMVYSAEKNRFDTEEVKLLVTLANNLALGIHNLRQRQFRKKAEQTLKLQLSAIESITDGIILLDAKKPDFPIVYVNQGFVNLTGYREDEAIGNTCEFLQGQYTEMEIIHKMYESLKNSHQFEGEIICHRKDGKPFWNHVRMRPHYDSLGELTHFVGLVEDITEHKKTLDEIREYAHIVSASHDFLSMVDLNYHHKAVNNTYVEYFEKPQNEIVNRHVQEIYGQDCFERVIKPNMDRCLSGQEIKFELTWDFPNKGIRHLEVHFTPLYSEQRDVTGISVAKYDITDRIERSKDVTKSRQKLRNLAQKLHSIREDERKAIAREIHDELGQRLTALKMDMSWIQDKLPAHWKKIPERMDSLIALADSTLALTRQLALELRPSILEDLGLLPAIEFEVSEFSKRYGVTCNVDMKDSKVEQDQGRDIIIFRIMQEALTNVARHAKATHVDINMNTMNNKLNLWIKDNGIGINQAQINHNRALGVIGMRERAGTLGGRVYINNIGTGGTEVRLELPLE